MFQLRGLDDVTAHPRSIKPLWGLIADSMPIFGRIRTPYFGLNSIFGVVAFVMIAAVPTLSLPVLLMMFFLAFTCIAWSDLLTEAVYSTHLRAKPEHGPDLISYVWGGIALGKLVSISIVGELLENVGNRAPYWFCAPAAAATMLITILNLPEEEKRRGRCCKKLGGSELPLAIVALVIGCGALGLSLLSVFGGDLRTKASRACGPQPHSLGLVTASLTPVVAKVNAFFFVQNICGLSISGASFYFFTDGPEAYPDGPHLDKVFYTTAIGIVSTIFTLVGMAVYNRWMQHWRYPVMLMVGSIMYAICNLLSCLVYTRANVRLGISDKVFVLASDAMQMVVFELSWLPNMLLMSQLCPKGCEATMFALLAGMGNLGMNLGGYFGAFMLDMLGVKPTGQVGDEEEFQNLWVAAAIAAVAPLVPVALVFQLIPNVSQKDKIEGLVSSSQGSPLSRFLSHYMNIQEEPSSDSETETEMKNMSRLENESTSDEDKSTLT
ncbi:unnamed protein product [Effrenium voratum]|nr:unnamed protein product [Effrenium voratum]